MVKNYLLLLSLNILFVFSSQGQNTLIFEVPWGESILINDQDESGVKTPWFKGATINYPFTQIPTYTARAAAFDNSNQLVFSAMASTNLSSEEAKAFVNQDVPNDWRFSFNTQFQNKQPQMWFEVLTVRRNPVTQQLEKLTKFSVSGSGVREASSLRSKTNTYASNSVLAAGTWFRVAVEKDGVFKITPALLQEMGAPNNINSNNIRIFGNGGGALPELNSTERLDDLQEIPIILNDGGDGVFNGNDIAMFYASGPHPWEWNNGSQRFEHRLNPYSDRNFYYITIDNGPGKRITTIPSPGISNPNYTTTTYDDYAFVEDEKFNLLKTGRMWFGDVFDFQLSYNYTFNFPNITPNSPVNLRVRAAGRATTTGTFLQTRINNSVVTTNGFGPISAANDADFVNLNDNSGIFNATGPVLPFTVTYVNAANPSGVAWLDFLEVVVRRNLVYQGTPLLVRDRQAQQAGGWAQFSVTTQGAGSQPVVLDVTNIHNARLQTTINQSGVMSFTASSDSLRQFAIFDPAGNGVDVPIAVGPIQNQDLHGVGPTDMVIVVHPSFLMEAERLGAHHRSEGLRVLVVTPQQIYNEFSSGAQDVTAIRDLMRMFQDRATSQQDLPKYLLLFGDASFDYKNKVSPNHNFVPIYQSPSSISLYRSFSSDDYFGFLDENEGTNFGRDLVDLGIGRLTVTTPEEARIVVDKIIAYATSSESYGSWRNKLLFVADDVDILWETILMQSANNVARKVETGFQNFNVDKVFSDAYLQVSSGGAQRYPDARDDLFRKLQSGNLITTFVGHGGPVRWTSETILTTDDINNLTNTNALPLWITITCEFTKLDDPDRVSAGERVLLNRRGGGIGLITTTRVVFVQPAVEINNAIFDTLFSAVDGQAQTLGEITRVSKNTQGVVGSNDRAKFSLIGDPALRLAVPRYNVVTDSINGIASNSFTDTITALSKMSVSGFITDENGNLASNYNGVIEPIVYDKRRNAETLANDGIGPVLPFSVLDNVIYRGTVEVINGRFNFEFIVPLDISFNFGNGRISYYSKAGEIDGAGFHEDFIIGGINPNPPTDNQGPVLRMFMNDESFVSGGLTDQNPILLALVSDSSGVNTVGNGIGRDITAILDGDLNQSFVLNDFYQANLNSYQSGTIRFPFFGLAEGPHNLRLRVWDVFNNPSEGELDFVVANTAEIALRYVLNYPNPFTTYTEFHFEHNRANQPMDVQVQIFTVSGKLVKTITKTIVPSGNRVSDISWDGRDDYGDLIGRGTYVYRLRVKSQFDDAYAEAYEKLVILR